MASRGTAPRRTGVFLRAVVLVVVMLGLSRLQDLIGVQLKFARLLLPLGALLLLLRADFGRRLRALRSPQALLLGLFVCAMVFSVPFSLHRGESLKYMLEFSRGPVALVLLVALAFTHLRDLEAMVRTVAIAGSAGGLALLLGFGTVHEGRAWFGGDASYDPNDMALVGVVALPFCVWMIRGRAWSWRVVGLVCVAGSLAAILLSGSRGGSLGLAAVVILLATLYRRHLSMKWRLVGAAGLVLALALAPRTFWTRVATIVEPGSDYNTFAESGRIEIWKRGIGYFASRPLTGVGMAQFGFAEGLYGLRRGRTNFAWKAAHSVWVQVAAELGIIGLAAFVGMYLVTLRDVLRYRRATRSRGPPADELAALGDTIGVATVGFIVSGSFLAMAYSAPAMMLVSLGIVFGLLARARLAELPARGQVHWRLPAPGLGAAAAANRIAEAP